MKQLSWQQITDQCTRKQGRHMDKYIRAYILIVF